MEDKAHKFSALVFLLSTFSLLGGCLENGGSVNHCLATDILVGDLDLTVNGEGLFVLSHDEERLYTRKGAFCVNSNGFLIHESGFGVSGFPQSGAGAIAPISVPVSDVSGAPLDTLSVDPQGVVTAHYLMGSDQTIARLGLALFSSPQNLSQLDAGLCRATTDSGAATITQVGAATAGSIDAGLEGRYECDRGSLLFNKRLRVSGDGYFRLDDQGSLFYSKDLALGFDTANFLVNADNYRLTGYKADSDGTILPSITALSIARNLPPVGTSTLTVSVNLDAGSAPPAVTPFSPGDDASYNQSYSIQVYDSLGASHAVSLYFIKQAAADSWESYAFIDANGLNSSGVSPTLFSFNGDGSIDSPSVVVYDAITPGSGAAQMQLTFNYADTTQNNAPFTVTSLGQDGSPVGQLSALHVTPSGLLTGDYTNGRTGVRLGQVILAEFAVPLTLESGVNGTYVETAESGPPTLVEASAPVSIQLVDGSS